MSSGKVKEKMNAFVATTATLFLLAKACSIGLLPDTNSKKKDEDVGADAKSIPLSLKLRYGVCTIWFFYETAVLSVIGFFIQLIVLAATLPFDPQRYYVGRYFRLLGCLCVYLNPIWKFRVHGPVPSYPLRNTVVVSNHESLADPFLISHLPWEMKWLSKVENLRIPFVGWLMAVAGDIPLSRGDKDSAKSAMGICSKLLKSGQSVCIFPEGTRSPTYEMLPFKDGAFRLAIQNGSDVLPIAIAGTHRALPKGGYFIAPSVAHVSCGTSISTNGFKDTPEDIERLKQLVKEQIDGIRLKIQPISSVF